MEKGRRKYLKENNSRSLSPWLSNQEQGDMVEFHCTMKKGQAELLDVILFRTDYSNVDQLEEDIYSFGRSLRKQDDLGRAVFVCMASILHNRVLEEQAL